MLPMTMAMTLLLLGGDYCMKAATQSAHPIRWLALSGLLWCSSIPGWYFLMGQNKLSTVGALFSVLSVIGTLLVGMLFFGERLGTREWIGMALAVVAVFLLANKA